MTLFPYVDSVCDKLDFIGINYYGQVSTTYALMSLKELGKRDLALTFTKTKLTCLFQQEVISGPALKLVDNDEYSESGRGVYPDGLFRMLHQFNERYKHLKVPFIITENGVSDETDLIWCPYLLEHLLAVYAAIITVLTLT